ncbi:MAG: hypothetical protein ACI8W7_002641 [Gammaproteobacteria bacterium]|jgi:hypothetical protein
MTKLHQIQFRYDAHQDRALLRLTTTARQEFRFWVTRRYAKLLSVALNGSAERGAAVTPALRETVLAFDQEVALASADFETQFNDTDTSTPLGDTPVLLARLNCTRENDGITLVAMHPLEGQGIEIRLDQTLLHSMLKLLTETALSAEWELKPGIAPCAPTGPLN